MRNTRSRRLRVIIGCVGISLLVAVGGYLWCQLLGTCVGQCLVVGQNVGLVCLWTGLRFGVAALTAGLVGYGVWVVLRAK